ncbi:MAG: CapA family protein [Caldicoprobacterales bacterium]|jgi:poly-gamma-glutamate capsule biosynthesis protein CapA/YwtB (metallophosphatase superfamily)
MKRGHKNYFLCTLFLCLILLVSCVSGVVEWEKYYPGANSQPEEMDKLDPEVPDSTPEPEPRGTTAMRIRAVGDIMMHMPLVNAAQVTADSYDFTKFFEHIGPYLEGADIVAGNLETTISNAQKGYGGYPMFRTPEDLLPALKSAGFNLLTTANNHTFDGKEFGVRNTLDKLDEYGFLHTGSARSQEERDQILVIEKNDIKAGVLAYTYGTNGMEVTISGENLPFMVNYIDREQIRRDVLLAREAGAEVLIVFIHWGDEYVRLPNSFQKETADYLISLGVDIIFGSHPHVLQPMERRPVTLDDGTEKEAFIIYSLGNFLSNQRDRYRDSGVIVDVDVIKDYDRGTIELGEVSYTPTWVYKYTENGRTDYRILPAGQFLDGNDELDLGKTDLERVQAVWSETVSHLGTEGAKANR